MTRALVMAGFMSLLGCDMAHPNAERFARCLPAQRCPVAGERCVETQALGMRCVPPCADPSDCLASEQCLPIGANLTPRGCYPAGQVEPGEPCAHPDDCVAGYACLGPELLPSGEVPHDLPTRCRAWCDRASDAGHTAGTCPTGQYCMRIYLPAPTLGACVLLCDPATAEGCPNGRICVSGFRCELPEDLIDCGAYRLTPCSLGQICDFGECLDPVTYATRHPPS